MVLARYLLKCASMFHGFKTKQTRQLTYEFAIKNCLGIPEACMKNKMACKDWFTRFMLQTNLCVRKQETKNASSTASFISVNLETFQDKLEN